MGQTNYFSGIVKVLENPIQTLLNEEIPITRFRAQLPQIRNQGMIHLVFWGNLANSVNAFYQANDYIIIEGYVSTRDNESETTPENENDSENYYSSELNTIEITVLKVYPFFLNPERQ